MAKGPRQVVTMLNGEKTECGVEARVELQVSGVLGTVVWLHQCWCVVSTSSWGWTL